jgi:hypothetical protein
MCIYCQSKASKAQLSPLWTAGMIVLMTARRIADTGSFAGAFPSHAWQELGSEDKTFGIMLITSLVVIVVQCVAAIGEQTSKGTTALCQRKLSVAAQQGDVMAVSKLLKDGADPNVIGKGRDIVPLQQAFSKSNRAMVSLLMANGAQIEHLTQCAPCTLALGTE